MKLRKIGSEEALKIATSGKRGHPFGRTALQAWQQEPLPHEKPSRTICAISASIAQTQICILFNQFSTELPAPCGKPACERFCDAALWGATHIGMPLAQVCLGLEQ
jgi:hypothetical protein